MQHTHPTKFHASAISMTTIFTIPTPSKLDFRFCENILLIGVNPAIYRKLSLFLLLPAALTLQFTEKCSCLIQQILYKKIFKSWRFDFCHNSPLNNKPLPSTDWFALIQKPSRCHTIFNQKCRLHLKHNHKPNRGKRELYDCWLNTRWTQ